MLNQTVRAVALSIAFGLLSACGDGGGTGPVVPANSFPLRAGYTALVAAGSSDNFTISGSCAGTASITDSAAAPSTFEGVAGFASTSTFTFTFTNCTPASGTETGITFYDANYTLLGTSIPGGDYEKFQTVPPPLPASVTVGNAATYGTLTIYADSSKTVATGTRVLSYVVEADTANMAIINLISKSYDNSAQLLSTQQSRYRIAASGTLTIASIDIQFSTTSTTHLLLTKS
jgi:hypothetical protein